jgi:hypothetical protein
MDSCLTPARGGKGRGMPATPVPAAIVTAEVNRLRDELDGMYAALQAKDEVLAISGNYGKALVEQNSELETRLATCVVVATSPHPRILSHPRILLHLPWYSRTMKCTILSSFWARRVFGNTPSLDGVLCFFHQCVFRVPKKLVAQMISRLSMGASYLGRMPRR